jgi:hypothetical protein
VTFFALLEDFYPGRLVVKDWDKTHRIIPLILITQTCGTMWDRWPGHLPRKHGRVNRADWARLRASDRRRQRVSPPGDARMGAIEPDEYSKPDGGGAVTKWSPE